MFKVSFIALFIILVMLVTFLGYSLGGIKICNDLDGKMDNTFHCHPNITTQKEPEFNFIIPDEAFINGYATQHIQASCYPFWD